MLTSASEQYRQQQKITAAAVTEARSKSTRGTSAVATVIATYQLEAAANSFNYAPEILAEQGIVAPSSGTASLSAVLTGPATVDMLAKTASQAAFDRLIATLVQDAGRTAATVDLGRRPTLTGYVRSLNPPSCSRCAILAGRVYRYSDGFQRHPLCDCIMTMTNEAIGKDLVTDPTDLIKNGQIRDLSKADMKALDAGANLGKLVNVRRSQAGLFVGSSVVQRRGGRLTPAGIMLTARDRAEVVELLKANQYIT